MSARLHPKTLCAPRAQAGIVLPIVLIFLVIMTILGVTVVRNVTLEERMAGSSRYQQLAFQSAERALRACEHIVQDSTAAKFYTSQVTLDLDETPVVGGNAGTYWEISSVNSRWGNGFRSDAANAADRYNMVVATTGSANGLLTAQCMIEKLNATASKQPGVPKIYCPFRVTARANDANGNAVAMVQSMLIAPPRAANLCP